MTKKELEKRIVTLEYQITMIQAEIDALKSTRYVPFTIPYPEPRPYYPPMYPIVTCRT